MHLRQYNVTFPKYGYSSHKTKRVVLSESNDLSSHAVGPNWKYYGHLKWQNAGELKCN